MKLYLKNATEEALTKMLNDFQAQVDFYGKKYNGPTLAKYQDMLDQVKIEIELRKKS